ncbi:unnamed protein product [Clavelina lepadiformis]|uniref:Deoxyribonuclease n=1 Tax=Clavelina lepadiformis TaxID=159417 RepID=A0ABP0FIR9_CLALP
MVRIVIALIASLFLIVGLPEANSTIHGVIGNRPQRSSPLRIGAFNIEFFGWKKLNNSFIRNIIMRIVRRYDIILVQEIRDVTQGAFPALVKRVNDSSYHNYDYVVSRRMGRKAKSIEQYGFIFRTDKVAVKDIFQYPDDKDVFEREPFCVRFERKGLGRQRTFTFIGFHAKPGPSTIPELNELVDVYAEVKKKFGEDVVVGGDYNADCRHVCRTCWSSVNMWTDRSYEWLIKSWYDTAVGPSHCAYDRLVVNGKTMKNNSRYGAVFKFDRVYRLTPKQTRAVSDHYPVQFYLY